MPNIMTPDCGWDLEEKLNSISKPVEATVEELNAVEGYDLTGKKLITVDLSSESSDVSIEEFLNMEDGKEYTLVASNGATTNHALIFPTGTLMSPSSLTVSNGDIIIYKFFTDGASVYCYQAKFA